MQKSRRFMGLLALLALCALTPCPAFAQGYEGLIAAPSARDKDTDDSQDTGYSGILAPKKKAGTQGQPLGYQGVVPGSVPKQEEIPQQEAPEISRDPAAMPDFAPQTVQQLKDAASIDAMKFDLSQFPDDFKKSFKMTPAAYGVLSAPRQRIGGLLPAEYAIKANIDYVMTQISDSRISREQQRKIADDAYTQLSMLASGVMAQKSVPDSIYEMMGVPPNYVEETKEGNEKALARLEAAIKILREVR